MSYADDRQRSLEQIARDVSTEQNPERFQKLVEELLHVLLAHELDRQVHLAPKHSQLSPGVNESIPYEKIVDDAVALMRSDYASLQMLCPERGRGGELRLLAFRGFNPDAARFWEWVSADSKSTCGMALRTTQRVVAPDIAACHFMADSEDQEVYIQTGIRACQTTPLIGCAGNVVGMISTHWRTPHQPSEEDFRQLEILARQASDLIERCMRHA
jgi:GAF domain-containing protein